MASSAEGNGGNAWAGLSKLALAAVCAGAVGYGLNQLGDGLRDGLRDAAKEASAGRTRFLHHLQRCVGQIIALGVCGMPTRLAWPLITHKRYCSHCTLLHPQQAAARGGVLCP